MLLKGARIDVPDVEFPRKEHALPPRVLNGPTGGRSPGTRGWQGRGMAGIRRSWGGAGWRGMNGRIENWDGPRFTVKN